MIKKLLFSGLIVLGLIAGGYGVYSAVNISDDVTITDSTGLVLHQTFNGSDMNWSLANAEARDTSGQNNHGDVVGAVATAGQVGQGLEFDGDGDYVDCGSSISLNENERTYSAWVKLPIQSGGGVMYRIILSKNNGHRGGIYLNRSEASVYKIIGKQTISGVDSQTTSSLLDENEWVFAAYTVKSGEQKLYIDGVEVDSDNKTGTIDSNSEPVRIGGGLTDRYTIGSMDEVRIYSRALSAQEIADQYRQGAKKFNIDLQKGLVGHWELSEESYNPATKRLTDNSAYSNHGTSANAGSFTTDRMGQSDEAMSFVSANDDEVNCGNDESLDINDKYTVSLWVKVSDWINWKRVFSKRIDIQNRIELRLDGENHLDFIIENNDVAEANIDSDVITPGDWNHLVFTIDETNQLAKLYQNGELKGTDTSFTLPDTSANDLFLGSAGGTSNFNGPIDEFRIYDRALSQEEITRLYEVYKPKFIMN